MLSLVLNIKRYKMPEILFVLYTHTYLDLIKTNFYVTVVAYKTEELCNKKKEEFIIKLPPKDGVNYVCKPVKYYER